MQRVVQERVGVAPHQRPDVLVVALHVQVAVGEAAEGVLPARLAADLAGLDEQQHLRVGPGRGDEGEQRPVDHPRLGGGVAVERGRQQPQVPPLALGVNGVAAELLGEPPHLDEPRAGGRGRGGGVGQLLPGQPRLRLPLVELLAGAGHEQLVGVQRVQFVGELPAAGLVVRLGENAADGRRPTVPRPHEDHALLKSLADRVRPREDRLPLEL